MTSRCSISAPASRTALASSPSAAKLADNREGAIIDLCINNPKENEFDGAIIAFSDNDRICYSIFRKVFGKYVMRSPTLKVIGIFLGSLFLFTWGLSDQEVISFDSRFYLFALEMWRHGLSWFPTTYHQPYPDYPALSTIFIYLAAWLAGGLNK